MKIILAPSKTRNTKIDLSLLDKAQLDLSEPLFTEEAHKLASHIAGLSQEQLAQIMKIKDPILTKTYTAYGQYAEAPESPAILSYTGTVFKELTLADYTPKQMKYLADNLIIMSALYGYLRPTDTIKHYRLDMTMKIMEDSLYKYWKPLIRPEYFPIEEPIICLASGEFAKMIPQPFINVEFKEQRDGCYKTLGTYSKKARGLMANYLISNLSKDLNDIKSFDLDGYVYNEALSTESNYVFTR